MCHCQLSLQPGSPPPPRSAPKFPNHTARKTVNSSEHFLQSSLLSFQAPHCITMASQGNKASVPQSALVCEQRRSARTWERRDERQRLCSASVRHLAPSWGCCDYSAEIASLSTRTKLTMANDPWTGMDSCRKCRQCSLHPEWIRYFHCIGPDTHTRHTCDTHRAHTHSHTLPMWFIWSFFFYIRPECYQLVGFVINTMKVCVRGPLLSSWG